MNNLSGVTAVASRTGLPKPNPDNCDIAGQAAYEGKHMGFGVAQMGARAYSDNPVKDRGFYYRGKLLSVTNFFNRQRGSCKSALGYSGAER